MEERGAIWKMYGEVTKGMLISLPKSRVECICTGYSLKGVAHTRGLAWLLAADMPHGSPLRVIRVRYIRKRAQLANLMGS